MTDLDTARRAVDRVRIVAGTLRDMALVQESHELIQLALTLFAQTQIIESALPAPPTNPEGN